MKKRGFSLGFLLSEVSKDHLKISSKLKELCQIKGIELHEIDTSLSLDDQTKFDAILHKCSDYMKNAELGNQDCVKILNDLVMYKENHPDVVMIDPPISVISLAIRERMLEICSECQFKYCDINVYVPNWVSIYQPSDLPALIHKKNIKFPVLFKAFSAAEGPEAHKMQLLFKEDQLSSLKLIPSVAQEFENHNGILYKIFVVNRKFCIVTRPSIQNICDKKINGCIFLDEMKESIYFDSHDVSHAKSSSFLNNFRDNYVFESSYGVEDCILNHRAISILVDKISDKLNIHLFGIDVIINSNGDYGVIDVNYLPSYSGMDNALELISDYLYDLSKDKADRSASDKLKNNFFVCDRMTKLKHK